MNRRDFARSSAVAVSALSYSQVLGANDRVSLGFIGLGNRGDQVLSAFLEHGDSQIDALCDLRQDYMDHAKQRSEKRGARRFFSDYRKLLEAPGLDAVVVCTPGTQLEQLTHTTGRSQDPQWPSREPIALSGLATMGTAPARGHTGKKA